MAAELGIHPRSLKNHIDDLMERNWMGHNPKSGYYFIRGFEKVKQLEGLSGRSAALLTADKNILDAAQFKGFVIGASIGHLANTSKWKEWCKRKSEHYKGSSKHRSRKHLPTYFPMACDAMRQIYGIANSTAHEYKKLAAKHGFILMKKTWEKLTSGKAGRHSSGSNGSAEKAVSAKLLYQYRAHHPEGHRIRVRWGKLYLQGPDMICPCLEFKRRNRRR